MKRLGAIVGLTLVVAAFVASLIYVDMEISRRVYGNPICAFVHCVRVNL